MPNHINSQVEITGTKEKMKKLIKGLGITLDLEAEEQKFDFNAIVKTPDNIFQGNLGKEEREKYGKNNWYDWNYENWGTKWNAYEVKLIDWSDTKLVVDIQTAWDTPHKIWEALEEQGFTVKGVYYGEMEGFEYIGDDVGEAFDAYTNVEIEYRNLEQGIEK